MDYLCKPVSAGEVLEVIAAGLTRRAHRHERLLRLSLIGKELIGDERSTSSVRHQGTAGNGASRTAILRLNRTRHEVEVVGEGSHHVTLTKSETAVLAVFLDNAGRVLSPRDLAYEAWDDELDPSQAASIIRPLIFRLRQKLENDPSLPRIIRTVRGAGYVFDSN